MNRNVRDFAEPVLGSRISIREFEWVGPWISVRQKNAQAQDIMRAQLQAG